MSSAHQPHGSKNLKTSISLSDKTFAIVVSEWNETITEALYEGAKNILIEKGATQANILRINVPGSYELSLGAQWMAEKGFVDAVICLGCVIQGETRHFEFICQAVSQGLTNVSLKYGKPVIFGVLTTNNQKQAVDRSGGKFGNKGEEAALTAIQMIAVNKEIIKLN